MTFPVYLAYKDSGVEWLGEVPEHWAVHPLKRAIERIESGTSVNAADFPAEPGSLGVLKTSCVYTGKFDWAENKTVDDEDLSRVSCPLRRDTLIVSRMNTPDLVGATGLVTEAPNGIFLPDRLWQVYFLVNHSPKFLFYFTKSREYREQVKMACSGTSASMQNLGQDDFRGLLFAEPPKPEQTQIARFLDHETARIDALIEEQQRLIELLKEKRQAVISHAVTRGLDPTVPMKDSEISYLDKSPIHWRLKRLGDVVAFAQGKAHEPYIDDDGDFICVNSRFVSTEGKTQKYCSVNLTPASVNDILMVMSDLPNGRALARAYYVIENGRLAVNQRVCRITAEQANSRFLFYLLNRHPGLMQNDDGVNQTHLSNSDFQKLRVFLPSLAEQLKIAHYLDHVTVRIDALISEAVTGVGLLQERRSALISAAVTGKIDVRGWQPPPSTQAPKPAVAEAV
ncbi:restriction endonuclease subunit S [Pseudomonas stutzeri]|nr:restriction endonuclease subunit S [Stutzerimonas stutzeri]